MTWTLKCWTGENVELVDPRNANFEHYFPICPNCKKLVSDSSEYSMSDKMCYECIHDLQVSHCIKCDKRMDSRDEMPNVEYGSDDWICEECFHDLEVSRAENYARNQN